ncbi:unnamed protein product [Orchesella dallaii]|uniref:Uncharacterized protein n=1 Tax=Orchesella dallaii TaxID=48710 RepID=A0ABP1QDC6_9HEXA
MYLNHTLCTYLIFASIFHILINSVYAEDVLDISYPILISENQEPLSRTYFGYTVSLAQGNTQPLFKHIFDVDGWIFIGAPKANASSTYYASNTVEPGVVWRCSLGRRNGIDNCEIMNVDPNPSPGKRQTTQESSPSRESHSGAFVGGALEVNHDHFLTCGWRWNRGKQQFYNGICYWFGDSNPNNRSSFRSNDLSTLVNKATYEQRLIPFYVRQPEHERLFTYYNASNQSNNAHEWQLSQLGISTHLFRDGNKEGTLPNLLIGAPGTREFSGAVVLYTNTKTPPESMARPNRNQNDPTFSQFVVGNRGLIPEKGSKITRAYWNEYFGYSVSSGRYLDKDKVHYASGAPRAEACGEVLIFDIPPPRPQEPSYKRQVKPVITIPAPGNAFGSYFGAVIHSVDLDLDGLDELVVGAPLFAFHFHSNKDKDTGNSSEENFFISEDYGGCVFVYNFNKHEEKPNKRYSSQTLYGSKSLSAQFGSAISSIKFDYANGTKEIYLVIGAPYEVSDDKSQTGGAIYLYKYNVASGKYGILSQRIAASQISPSLKGFGCSISLLQDIDFNKTPDIAIGSYKSGQAVILRTRPKILIKSWITFSSEGKPIGEIRRSVKTFYLNSCFNMTIDLGKVDVQMDFWVQVKLSDPTIRFRGETSNNEVIYSTRASTFDPNCRVLTIDAVHSGGIGMDDSNILKERITPLHFTQEVWYNDTLSQPDQPPSVLQYYATPPATPILQSHINFKSFNPGKPSYQISTTLANLPIQPTDCKGRVCIPKLSISSWFFYNENNETISTFLLGSSKVVSMKIVISNDGETAIEPTIVLDWNNLGIKESESGSRWISENCVNVRVDSLGRYYRCGLGQYIRNNQKKIIDIDLNMAEIYAEKQENYKLIANGGVSDKNVKGEDGKAELTLDIPPILVSIMGSRDANSILRNQIEYNTSVMDSSKMTLYSPFSLDFSTRVLGASVKSLTAQFKLPMLDGRDKNDGKPLFLILQPQMDPPNWAECTSTPGFHRVEVPNSVSSDSFQKSQATTKQLVDPPVLIIAKENYEQKRDVDRGSSAIAIDRKPPTKPTKRDRLIATEDSLTLSCEMEENSCMDVSCKAVDIKSNGHYRIQFELYPIKDAIDEIIKDSGKSFILVEGKGYANIFNSGNLHKDNDVGQTVLSKNVKNIQLWVYIVAGIGGLLFLLLITLVLYKCGFFKREKLQQLNHMKAEHHRKSMMVAARASMMQSPSAGLEGFGSQDMLAEAEHENEDTTPEETPTELKDDK